ncbi:MAG: hypothetical protein WBB01_15445 [Phormidesmis sp.]
MTSTPPSTPSEPTIQSRLRGKLREFIWPLLWMAILAAAGGVGLRAVSVMTQNPPLPDCTRISAFNSDSEQLLCAQASVRSGSAQALVEAIELVAPWTPSNPLYDEANRLMNRWSKALLEELDEMVQQGDIRQARSLVARIPKRVESYPEVKSAIATWDKEWSTGREFEAETLQAIKAGDWVAARRGLQGFKTLDSNYWVLTRYEQLKDKIEREQTARVQLDKARALAKTGDLKKLGEALAIAKDINLKTAAWAEAKPDLDEWAEKVLQYSFQKWEEEDLEAAIALVEFVPPDLARTAEARDLISFGYAQRLAKGRDDEWTPSYGQVYNLKEAIQAVQRISPDSPFYEAAQTSLTQWQQQLDDMAHLQYASALAEVGQQATYRWAIAEAEKITQERPQRLQAQTLVSHWQKEIERIEDRPILNRAVRMASAGGKENLQAAIAAAKKVELGRALRVEGQTYIAEWVDRIEIIEDQPFIDKAQQLASGGKLKAAITEAKKVAKGRALYDEAQVAIKDWTGELEIRADRPILTRAENLAAIGSLTAAIDTAAQIAPGRALYGEARTSIAIWEQERAYIWSIEAPAEDSYSDEGYSDDGYYDDGYSDDSYYDDGYYDDGW